MSANAELEVNPLDTKAFGFAVFNPMIVASESDVERIVAATKLRQNAYGVAKIPVDRVDLVHKAEDLGLRFLEIQYETQLTLNRLNLLHSPPAIASFEEDAYEYIRVDNEQTFNEVARICAESIVHDRVSLDPELGPEVSKRRYELYLKQSFLSNNEEIWCVKRKDNPEILTFRSHHNLGSGVARLLLGGVRHDLKELGLGGVSSRFCFKQLAQVGFKRAISSISAGNLPIVNLEVNFYGFRVRRAYSVLRAMTRNGKVL
jgi:hypothetical protein